MKRMSNFFVTLVFLLSMGLTPSFSTNAYSLEQYYADLDAQYADCDYYAMADEMIAYTNELREELGLTPLATAPILTEMSMERVVELTVSFSHIRPNGKNSISLYSEYGLSFATFSENIAYGAFTAKAAVEQFQNSEAHYDTMVSTKFNYMGVGVIYANHTFYWVQYFLWSNEELEDSYTPTLASLQSHEEEEEIEDTTETPTESSTNNGTRTLTLALGDIDLNGTIDAIDVILLLQYVGGCTSLNYIQLAVSDINADGFVNSTDALCLQRYLVELYDLS